MDVRLWRIKRRVFPMDSKSDIKGVLKGFLPVADQSACGGFVPTGKFLGDDYESK